MREATPGIGEALGQGRSGCMTHDTPPGAPCALCAVGARERVARLRVEAARAELDAAHDRVGRAARALSAITGAGDLWRVLGRECDRLDALRQSLDAVARARRYGLDHDPAEDEATTWAGEGGA